jgi:hypothetical protein
VPEWDSKEVAPPHEVDNGPRMAKELLLLEYGELGRALLAHDVVGRLVNALIILCEVYFKHANLTLEPIVLLVALYALFWVTGTSLLRTRRQFTAKRIAENAYLQDREWGTLYIKTYQERYEWMKISSWIMRFEPLAWVVLSIVVLAWK